MCFCDSAATQCELSMTACLLLLQALPAGRPPPADPDCGSSPRAQAASAATGVDGGDWGSEQAGVPHALEVVRGGGTHAPGCFPGPGPAIPADLCVDFADVERRGRKRLMDERKRER